MILSFDKENCTKRNFVQKILKGSKKHTCRIDKHKRWKAGMPIEFYRMNPRNGGYQFAAGKVFHVDEIIIDPEYDKVIITLDPVLKNTEWYRDGMIMLYGGEDLIETFAQNDGFESWEEMKTYFKTKFIGRMIVWQKGVQECIVEGKQSYTVDLFNDYMNLKFNNQQGEKDDGTSKILQTAEGQNEKNGKDVKQKWFRICK